MWGFSVFLFSLRSSIKAKSDMSVSHRRFASSVMPLSAFVDELDIGKQQIVDEANPDLGHDGVVPRKFLILRFCLIHLKKSSICHRYL